MLLLNHLPYLKFELMFFAFSNFLHQNTFATLNYHFSDKDLKVKCVCCPSPFSHCLKVYVYSNRSHDITRDHVRHTKQLSAHSILLGYNFIYLLFQWEIRAVLFNFCPRPCSMQSLSVNAGE